MRRWLLWLAVGLVIYVLGTVAYMPETQAPRLAQLAATVALRLWTYTTGAALIWSIASWLIAARRPK
jgi:hypothetical protein